MPNKEIKEKENPIFTSTYQALQVAYYMAIAPGPAISPLITIYKLYGDKNFDEKIKTSGINFGGISALEQYAECANIRRLVEKTLSGFELDVILAKFARDHFREESIKRVQKHLKHEFEGVSRIATNDIVNWIFCDNSKKPSIRNIARHHGLSHDTMRRAISKGNEIILSSEFNAIKQLSVIFIKNGIASE